MKEANKYEINDEYRKGLREGKQRIAGITSFNRSEDEQRGLIMALETALIALKGKLYSNRKNKSNFKLKIVK